jgi:putative oxygen-independent coproporphyrinogen III oxidase
VTVTARRTEPAAPGRAGGWLEEPGLGVYVHVPFCLHRCRYCDFNTYEGLGGLHAPYADAVVRDIERWPGPDGPATSVFFGGGTPTLLEPRLLTRMLGAVRARFGLVPGAEVTVEANPETVDEDAFGALLDAGFNRFSVGVQSLCDHVLAGLGRTHSATRALDALAAARRAGVEDLNADLIYGSPWETGPDWASTLHGIVDAEPDHVSAYALTVEEGTPLATLVRTGRAAEPDPDVQADRHGVADGVLDAAGLRRYEVSNWSRPGRASRHNCLYWSAGDYVGFGAGAHSHLRGRRWWSVRLPRLYVDAVAQGRTVVAGDERLGPDERAGEALVLGLRLRTGVDLGGFVRRFGHGALARREAAMADLEARGLVERRGGFVRVAEAATLVADEVARALL